MRLTLLGTGNAPGIPVYGCNCHHCRQTRETPVLRRGPACALLEADNNKYLLDAGLMNIAERYPAGELTGILLTHFHVDHVQGLFHLRWGREIRIPVYCPQDSEGCADLFKYPGILDFQQRKSFSDFKLGDISITCLPLNHSKPAIGYAFETQGQRIAYLTDTRGLPAETLAWLEQHPLELLVIDTSYPPDIERPGHNNLDETLLIHKQLTPKRTVLTHIGHELAIWLTEHGHELPDSVIVAKDGEQVFPFAAS